MSSVGRLLAAVVGLVLPGCEVGSLPGTGEPLEVGGAHISDNAAPVHRGDDGWSVTDSTLVRISGSDTRLYQIAAAKGLPEGRILVANAGRDEVVLFGPGGDVLSRFGRSGLGPGEIDSLEGMFLCGGDTLAIVDNRRRLTKFNLAGTAISTVELSEKMPSGRSVFGGIFGVSDGCRRALLLTAEPSEMDGIGSLYRYPQELWWIDLTGGDGEGDHELVHRFSGPEMVVVRYQGRPTPVARPWGAVPVWGVIDDDHVAIADGRDAEVQIVGDSSETWTIRWSASPRAIDERSRDVYERRRQEWIRSGRPSAAFPALDDVPVPATMPAVSKMRVDDTGKIWLQRYPLLGGGRASQLGTSTTSFAQRWTIIGPDGRWLSDIEISADFDLFDVHEGRLIGVSRDDWDVEHIVVYGLVRY